MPRRRDAFALPAMCRMALVGLCLVGGPGCGSDDDGRDGDGGTTPCGDDAGCDRAGEICVRRQVGFGTVPECAPLPDGCAAERSCAACGAVCEEPADTCADTGEDNTLSCVCTECRAAPARSPARIQAH
jgi:hypothetical protein